MLAMYFGTQNAGEANLEEDVLSGQSSSGHPVASSKVPDIS